MLDLQESWLFSTVLGLAITGWVLCATILLKLKKTIEQRDILNQDLEQTSQASNAKSDFLANMSHEIRTPINVVMGMTDLLSESPLNHEQLNWVNTLTKSSEHLLALVNDILDFSKIEAHVFELQENPFDLVKTSEQVTDIIKIRAREKNLELITQIDPDVPINVIGDSGRLRQVLLNLCVNAVKFTDEGHVLIRIRKKEIRAGRVLIGFEIQDTGIGIPQEQIKRVFEKYTHAVQSGAQARGGAGLGLSICQGIVEKMGGQLSATSTLDHGSTFTFTVWLGIDTTKQTSVTISEDDLKDIKALVIEDCKISAAIMLRYLSSWKVTATHVTTAEEALSIVDQTCDNNRVPYDCMLIDHYLEGMTGMKLVEQIRQRESCNHLSLIMITSITDPPSAEVLQTIGLDALLIKPFYPAQLHAVLKTCLQQSHVQPRRRILVTRENAHQLVSSGNHLTHTTILTDKRVLVVDDMQVNLMLTERAIKKHHSIDVMTANSGKQALDIISELSQPQSTKAAFDLIFLDCQMPGMDGYATAKAIRELESKNRYPSLVIVALTADATVGDRERCLTAGMNDYLSKPARAHDIANILTKYLNQRPIENIVQQDDIEVERV